MHPPPLQSLTCLFSVSYSLQALPAQAVPVKRYHQVPEFRPEPFRCALSDWKCAAFSAALRSAEALSVWAGLTEDSRRCSPSPQRREGRGRRQAAERAFADRVSCTVWGRRGCWNSAVSVESSARLWSPSCFPWGIRTETCVPGPPLCREAFHASPTGDSERFLLHSGARWSCLNSETNCGYAFFICPLWYDAILIQCSRLNGIEIRLLNLDSLGFIRLIGCWGIYLITITLSAFHKRLWRFFCRQSDQLWIGVRWR